MLTKHGRKVVGDTTANSSLYKIKVTKAQFADEAALQHAFEGTTQKFIDAATKWVSQ